MSNIRKFIIELPPEFKAYEDFVFAHDFLGVDSITLLSMMVESIFASVSPLGDASIMDEIYIEVVDNLVYSGELFKPEQGPESVSESTLLKLHSLVMNLCQAVYRVLEETGLLKVQRLTDDSLCWYDAHSFTGIVVSVDMDKLPNV